MAASEPSARAKEIGAPRGPRFFSGRDDRLWKIFWLWGIPAAWATSLLVLAGEAARTAGYHGWRSLVATVLT